MTTKAPQQPPTKAQLDKAIADAVRLGNVSRVQALLEGHGCDPNAKVAGHPLITLAVKLKTPKMAELLLKKGAEPNAVNPEGNSALMLAARLCKEDFMRTILLGGASLQQKNPSGETAESIALDSLAASRAMEMKLQYRDLEEQKEKTDKWLKLALAMLATNPDPDAAVDGHPGITIAVLLKQPDELKRLIAAGANIDAVNPEGNSALILATRDLKPAFVSLLIDAGANQMLQNDEHDTATMVALKGVIASQKAEDTADYDFNLKDIREKTAQWESLALSLVAHPAYDPKAERGGASLPLAVQLRNAAAFETLLEKGAPINSTTPAGDSALHMAAACFKRDAIDNLLARGASLLQRNKDQGMPVDSLRYAFETASDSIGVTRGNRKLKPETVAATIKGWEELKTFLTAATDRELDSLSEGAGQSVSVRNKPFKLKPVKSSAS